MTAETLSPMASSGFVVANPITRIPATVPACIPEETMDFPEVKGAVRFLHMLKTKGYRVGLVTSSYRIKIERALKLMDIEKVFRHLSPENIVERLRIRHYTVEIKEYRRYVHSYKVA